jgi:hypothetical protein
MRIRALCRGLAGRVLSDAKNGNSSKLQRDSGSVRLWFGVRNTVHAQGRHSRGNLFRLPSILHRQTEAGGYGWPSRTFPPQVCQVRRWQDCYRLKISTIGTQPEASSNGGLRCVRAFPLLVYTGQPTSARLFLKKRRTSLLLPVQSRSENALEAVHEKSLDEEELGQSA